MKRLAFLILVLLMAMSTTVNAANSTVGQNGTQSIDVTAKYQSSGSTPTVYSVDIEWEDMTFTYTQRSSSIWNAADHTYSGGTSGSWDKTAATIKVTNHSNAKVDADITYTANGDTGVTGTLTNNSGSLAAGVVGGYDTADHLTATLTISGTPNSSVTADGIKVGSITVTIH